MEREIEIGDLVRIAPRRAVTNSHSKQVGLVVGFGKTKTVGIVEPGKSAKIIWMSGTETVTGLPMLERVR